MRIQNSLKNILFGLSGQLLSIGMGFVVRTVFIYTLGVEYLGVDGLFTSILIMFSLANLGFDTAIIYSLYKPLAENDIYKIQALMNLYQKAYRLIGLIVLLLGLSLLPFLPYITNAHTTIENINMIYLLFLVSSVSSYYFVYKQSIIIADQRNHVISKIHSIFTIISHSLQIFLLVAISNYILVLIVQLVLRIIENIYIANTANKLYPYLQGKNNAKLSKEDRKLFFENLYALLLYKISGVVINGTDNIVISKFIGIIWVGVYSNYLLILNTLNTLLGYFFYSVTASVGNLNAKEDAEKKYFIFRVMNFANFWIYGFCTVCLWNLMNPFITLWLGKDYVFNKYIIFAIILNFFTAGMQNAATTFRETTGLFKKGKYRPIIAAVINIVVSIILAKHIGIAGVFLGTIISRLCTYFWYDPYIIFNLVFKKSVKLYFARYGLFVVLVLVAVIITDILGNIFNNSIVSNMVIRSILCLVIPNTIFFMVFRKSEEFEYLINVFKTLTNKIISRRLAHKNSSKTYL
ncbi:MULTISPECIES: lipopolysaccharide biosynthesis protein [Bacillus cereus group]|uniref:Sugar translocase n=1 Tax=Bacillus cereus TaxID=1396 RepID=A0A2A8U6V0_BACCE|nr:sugar translocase [Bacillus cereus]PDY84798.1 sugar translocase [Bacillus cereus]PFA14820.1 sugar translocase [Bacillus cereus]PFM38836.1 sugar translocase [Bacillus cereus]PGQ12438.1 sugar translocase [Bacillus cereus]